MKRTRRRSRRRKRRKSRKRRRRNRTRRRRRRKRGSGTPRATKRKSVYYSARMNSAQTEEARRAVSKIMGNATRGALNRTRKKKQEYFEKKAGPNVRVVKSVRQSNRAEIGRQPTSREAEAAGRLPVRRVDDLFDEQGRMRGPPTRPDQLRPARGTIESDDLRPTSGNARNNDFAARHPAHSKKGKKRQAAYNVLAAPGRAVAGAWRWLTGTPEKKKEKQRAKAQKELRELALTRQEAIDRSIQDDNDGGGGANL